jgi:hypothetical protein
MTQPEPPTYDCTLDTILGFLLPFFLAAASGNPEHAKAAIRELIGAYNASTPQELDLVGRIIGFSIASLDNLRLSMTPDLSDTKVLRYRSNAVTLSRASNQAMKALEALQAKQEQPRPIPRPSVAAAPPPPAARAQRPATQAAAPTPSTKANTEHPPLDIEAMKREARVAMMAFSKNGPQGAGAIAAIANPAVMRGPAGLPIPATTGSSIGALTGIRY